VTRRDYDLERVRRRRVLPPATVTPEKRAEASRQAWHHLRDLGLMSETVERTLAELAEGLAA
jgi:hypothetical protein